MYNETTKKITTMTIAIKISKGMDKDEDDEDNEQQAKWNWLVEQHYKLGLALEYGEAMEEEKAELEKLDQQKKEIMDHASDKCCKFRMGQVNFTSKVEEARGQCQVWQLVVKR